MWQTHICMTGKVKRELFVNVSVRVSITHSLKSGDADGWPTLMSSMSHHIWVHSLSMIDSMPKEHLSSQCHLEKRLKIRGSSSRASWACRLDAPPHSLAFSCGESKDWLEQNGFQDIRLCNFHADENSRIFWLSDGRIRVCLNPTKLEVQILDCGC